MTKPSSAVLLAAGFGKRMQPLSNTTPKPLLKVGGQAQIQYIYDTISQAGIKNIVVNAHHLSQQIQQYFALLNATVVVEREILETGGGVLNVLNKLSDVFVVANTDAIVVDNNKNFITKMINDFDDSIDGLLLVIDKNNATNYNGSGDMDMDKHGNITRNKNGQYVFCGVQILRKSAFKGLEVGNFSLNIIYDKLAKMGKLKAIIHTGKWYHISTPEDVKNTNLTYDNNGEL